MFPPHTKASLPDPTEVLDGSRTTPGAFGGLMGTVGQSHDNWGSLVAFRGWHT